jgi:hypothetical protein
MADGANTNREKLKAFVAFHIGNAPTKADPVAYLMGWADFVDGMFAKLGTDAPGMAGLTAFDLADARDELATAAGAYERRVA